MKKKLTALSLVFTLILLSFSGCGKNDVFLDIGGQSITEGLFSYYLDTVVSYPERYGIDAENADEAIEAAVICCKQYVAAESFLKENQLGLTTESKRAAANEVETLWSLYREHYIEKGITKPDLTLAVTHEYRMKRIVDYYYGADGLEPIDEDDLKEEFVDLYVGFRVISVPLSKVNNLGETVPMNEDEKKAQLELLRGYRNEINDGTSTIDEINVRYNETRDIIVTESLGINVVKIGDPMYTKEFYETMTEISHTKAGIIDCGTVLYLVQREKIATTEEDEFYRYRAELIEELKMDEIKEKVAELASEMEYEIDSDKAKDIYYAVYDRETDVTERSTDDASATVTE